MICALAAICASTAHGRERTRADQSFCERYAGFVQEELDAYRSGEQSRVLQFQQALSRDPHASLIMAMGLGWYINTPPWISDVSDAAHSKCVGAIQSGMWGYLPGDPERPKPGNSANSHVGTTTRRPAGRDAVASAPTAPPDADEFEGTFIEQSMHTPVNVSFKRHTAICFGGTLVTVARTGMTPLQTCGVRERPGAYIVRFPQGSFGEVSVPFSTMHPMKADQAAK